MSARFEPLAFAPGYRRVAGEIAARILDRTLKVGEPLPSELELAAQFGVNRSMIREALRELESADLIARRRGTKRMVVVRPAAAQVAGRLRQAFALNDVTVREVWQMLEVLEPPAAQSAAAARTPATLARIESAVAGYRGAHRQAPLAVEGVGEFFRAIAGASGNRLLPLIQEPLLQLLAAALGVLIEAVPPARERIGIAQERICAAIADGDGELARNWMAKHVRDFRRGFELCRIELDTPVPLG
ncbi:MAG TPA: GntR family transcriptional regulator [Steroidobacteraceae bacterium]|nr:GntR family transcriptional regulator [Steroidobacteraceae bacterium]